MPAALCNSALTLARTRVAAVRRTTPNNDPSRQATEAFARHIAHARIAVLHEAADRPLDARPEAVAALLADFLHGVEDGAPLGGSIIA